MSSPPQENHDPFEGLNWTSKSFIVDTVMMLYFFFAGTYGL